MYCGQQTFVKATFAEVEAKRLYCRAWTCETCAPKRRKRLIAEAIGGQPNRFITLTLPPTHDDDPEGQVKTLSRAWRLIRKRLEREGMKRVEFLAVVELTPKARRPHLHILARCGWIDQQHLSEMMDEIADAPIVDIRAADNAAKRAAYVAKYVSKDSAKVGNCKRYWKSKGYDLRNPKEIPVFEAEFTFETIRKGTIENHARSFAALGYEITWDGSDRFSGRCQSAPWSDLDEQARSAVHNHDPPAGGALRAASLRPDLSPWRLSDRTRPLVRRSW